MLPADEKLASNIERAYQQSNQLLMEIDMDDVDPFALQATTMELGLLPDGKDLLSELDAATRRQFQAAATALNLDGELLAHFQPWLAALTLEQMQYAKQGFTAESGIELQLTQRAAQDHKALHGLETISEQLNLLAQQDEKAQLAYLRQTLNELNESPQKIAQLLNAWRNGDTQFLQTMLRDSVAENPSMFARLITERNQRWLTTIKPLLDKQTDNYLVAVGALHLIGDQGLVALLKRAGYTVTRQ